MTPAPRPPDTVPASLLVSRWASRIRSDVAVAALDAVLTAGAYAAMLMLRFDGRVPTERWRPLPAFLLLAVIVHLVSNRLWGLYGRIWRHAGVQEARRVLAAGAMATVALLASQIASSRTIPLSVVGLGGVAATILVGLARFQSRLFYFHRAADQRSGLRVAVIGAGESGAAVVREMRRSPASGLIPVVLLDDDPHKQGRVLLDLPVFGGIDRISQAVSAFDVNQALLAIPSAMGSVVERAAAAAEAAGIPLKVLPGVADLIQGRVSVQDARALRIEDLLGREQVATDLDRVRSVLHGRRVLITGGGGSIGGEIARQVMACEPASLVLLDHDETHLHDAVGPLEGSVEQVLADVRDGHLMVRLFDRHRPDVVFHAAAHKHVPLLESHPSEAVINNVLGTLHVVTAARSVDVERFLFVSTDKAVRPSSIMGASKRLGEQIVMAQAPPDGRWSAVRFGNVLGSRGSVIPTFTRQIAAGGPVTVTDPRMTRFFMSIQEAVQLVLQAAALASGRDVFMLEMGRPVEILGLAHRMIRLSGFEPGTEIPIRITGTRPGEKLVEELQGPDEQAEPTSHPSIVRLVAPPVPADGLEHRLAPLFDLASRRCEREAGVELLRIAALPVPVTASEQAPTELAQSHGM